MKIEFDKKIPTKIVTKAHEILARVETREIRPQKIKVHGALSVEIGRDWRAIKFTDKDYWFVCSHERYNRLNNRGR